jgi:hypothetical protein
MLNYNGLSNKLLKNMQYVFIKIEIVYECEARINKQENKKNICGRFMEAG